AGLREQRDGAPRKSGIQPGDDPVDEQQPGAERLREAIAVGATRSVPFAHQAGVGGQRQGDDEGGDRDEDAPDEREIDPAGAGENDDAYDGGEGERGQDSEEAEHWLFLFVGGSREEGSRAGGDPVTIAGGRRWGRSRLIRPALAVPVACLMGWAGVPSAHACGFIESAGGIVSFRQDAEASKFILDGSLRAAAKGP